MRFLILIVLISLTQTPFESHASDSFQYPIYVAHEGSDSVGQQISYRFRNAVRDAPHLELKRQFVEPYIRVVIISGEADSDPDFASLASFMSVAVTIKVDDAAFSERYLTSMLKVCGSRTVDSCAVDIVALLDRQIARLERYYGDDIELLFE